MSIDIMNVSAVKSLFQKYDALSREDSMQLKKLYEIDLTALHEVYTDMASLLEQLKKIDPKQLPKEYRRFFGDRFETRNDSETFERLNKNDVEGKFIRHFKDKAEKALQQTPDVLLPDDKRFLEVEEDLDSKTVVDLCQYHMKRSLSDFFESMNIFNEKMALKIKTHGWSNVIRRGMQDQSFSNPKEFEDSLLEFSKKMNFDKLSEEMDSQIKAFDQQLKAVDIAIHCINDMASFLTDLQAIADPNLRRRDAIGPLINCMNFVAQLKEVFSVVNEFENTKIDDDVLPKETRALADTLRETDMLSKRHSNTTDAIFETIKETWEGMRELGRMIKAKGWTSEEAFCSDLLKQDKVTYDQLKDFFTELDLSTDALTRAHREMEQQKQPEKPSSTDNELIKQLLERIQKLEQAVSVLSSKVNKSELEKHRTASPDRSIRPL